jgi:WS/DGAT/MGAT family acyltransferase
MKQLTPADVQFYTMDQANSPFTISVMWICNPATSEAGEFNFDDVYSFLHNRIDNSPVFHRTLFKAPMELDYPYWAHTDNIDYKHHIKHLGLPHPGNWDQLRAMAAAINTHPMDHSRPPWDIHIIDGIDGMDGVAKGSYAVISRFHHAYVDGKAFLQLVYGLMSDTPETGKPKKKKRSPAKDLPTEAEMWARTLPRMWEQSVKSWRSGYKTAQKGWELINELRTESKPDQIAAPRTRFNGKVADERTYNSINWEVADLQAIRALQAGTSINDVMISIIGGGMRRYLIKHDELPEEKSLIAACPVSVRPKEDADGNGNMISMMMISVGTDEGNPSRRLAKVQSRTARGIPLARDIVSELTAAMDDSLPAYMRNMQSWAMDKIDIDTSAYITGINMVISNVPGPVGATKYFAGAEITSAHPIGPLMDGNRLFHGITNIGSRVVLGVSSDKTAMEDNDFYMECLEESKQELLKAAQKTTAKADAGTKARAKTKAQK